MIEVNTLMSIDDIKEKVFDIMLHCGINYFPAKAHFNQAGEGKLYGLITRMYGIAEIRRITWVRTKVQYQNDVRLGEMKKMQLRSNLSE